MTKTFALSLVFAASLGLAACSAEEADNAMNDAGAMTENAMDAADNTMDAAMNAGDNMMDEAGNMADNAVNAM